MKTDEEIKKEYLERLNKDVQASEIRKDNLESQIHSLQVRLDGERKLVEQEKIIKFSEEKKKLAKMENDFYTKSQMQELKDVQLKDREKTIDTKEIHYSQFVADKKVFNKDKILFQEYKTKIEKELKETQGVIADINSKWGAIESDRQVLNALEKTLTEKEDDLDVQYGILEKDKKDFEIYKQSEISRYTEKEVVNV